jgi:hypothetical protein
MRSWTPCYLLVLKTSTVGMLGRANYNVLFSECSDGSFTEPVVATSKNNMFSVELAWGETIHSRKLEFIADRFDNLSLSLEGIDSGIVFVGMTQSGSPSPHAILEEFASEDDSVMTEGGSSGFPISQESNVVKPTIPMATTPPPEGTPAPLTIPTILSQTTMPQPDSGLLPELLQAYQEEQQHTL